MNPSRPLGHSICSRIWGDTSLTAATCFQPGDYLDANGPICLNSDTLLTALAFVEDPDLPELNTPNGSVQFIQMVGITCRELEMIQSWNTRGFLAACESYMPKYVTDLMRNSYADIPSVIQATERGIEEDGSSTAFCSSNN